MNTSTKTTMLTGLISLCLFSPAIAADFSGNLKGVTITDSQAANKPPIAAFTYTVSKEAVTFDANGSSDPDGSIVEYKWDCGNGVAAAGSIASCPLVEGTSTQVTLAVVDNNGGVGITQQTVDQLPKGIADDYSSDTSAQYTTINGSISITNGTLGGGNTWTQNYAIHNTSTGSNDHYVQGKIQTGGVSAGGVIGLRSNGTTGYLVCLNKDASRLNLYAFNGKVLTGNPNGNYAKIILGASGAGSYTVKLSISGSVIRSYIDLNNNGLFTDANEDLGSWNDATYSAGQHVVAGAFRGSDNGDYRVDNLSGGL